MTTTFYGYIRVSSVDQNEARQTIELNRYGIIDKNIYADKQSGKDFMRPKYQQLKHKLHEGDILVVKSIDRLGRNYEEIQNEWREIVKEKKVDIVVLDMPILDTRTNKDLIGTLISDIVLQLLSYVAQAERENIRQRQAEGIAAAKARGAHLGRYAKPLPPQFYPVFKNIESGLWTRQQAADCLHISISQFDWMVKKYKKKRNENKTNHKK